MLLSFIDPNARRRSNTSEPCCCMGSRCKNAAGGGIKVTGGLSRGRKRCLKRTARESHVGRLCRIAAAQKAPNRAKAGGAGSRRGGEARHSPLHTAWEFFRSPSSRWRRTLFAVVNSSLSSCTADLPKRLSSSNKVSNKLGRASPSLLVSPLPADF